MENNSPIIHDGIVQNIDGQNVMVKLTVQSACAACHAKGVCGAADSQDKMVMARNVNDETFAVGEKVRVELRQALAFKAVVICYLLPFIVLMTTFCLMSYFVGNELLGAGVAFLATVVYYFFIWLFNKKIERKFICFVTKLPQE